MSTLRNLGNSVKGINIGEIVGGVPGRMAEEVSATSEDSRPDTKEYGEENIDNIKQSIENVKVTESIPNGDVSRFSAYTIPEGTTLYHGSKNIRSFDPVLINLGDTDYVAFFTPNKAVASSFIKYCAATGEDKNPNVVEGYIHQFITVKEINNVDVIDRHDKNLKWTEKGIDKERCMSRNQRAFIPNAVGFFVPATEFANFTEEKPKEMSEDLKYSQFAICNPREYLKYIGTYNCTGPLVLSREKRNFDTNEIIL